MIKILINIMLLCVLWGCVDKLSSFNLMSPVMNGLKQSTSPVIVLKGENPLILNKGSDYVEPGATAADSVGNDLSSKVVVTSNVNKDEVGVYSVQYVVSDDNNRKTIANRIVNVVESVSNSTMNTSNGEIKAIAYPNQGDSPYEYNEYLPKGYIQNPALTYPLVIFLHGLGEQGGVDFTSGQRSGVPLSTVLLHGPLKRVKEGVHFPAIIVQPQSPVWWNSATLKKFLEVMKARYRVNPKKVYFTGMSMGGGGTWDFARAYPNDVAAIVPICGASAIGNIEQAKPLLLIPIWAFHARGDGTVPLSNSYSFLNFIFQAQTNKTESFVSLYNSTTTTSKTAAIENKSVWMIYEGVNPGSSKDKMLTIYPHSSHDSWTETYKNQLMWDWLFSKTRP